MSDAVATTEGKEEPATTAADPAPPEPPVDAPPLWTPADEQLFRRAARSRPPDAVEGWTTAARVRHFFLASPRTMLARGGMLVAVVVTALALPGLAADSSWGNLGRVAWYHGWTLVVLLAVSAPVRALPAHRVIRFAILGASAGALAVYYLAGPLTDLFDPEAPAVWISPPLEETIKLLLVAVVLVSARRRLQHPGVVDLIIIGYAVGAGFSFHEDALWGRSTATGFEGLWGLLFPSFFQPAGLFLIAHAGWTALAGAGFALIVLHWRRPVFAVAGAAMIVATVADHMAVNDRDGSFDWVMDVLFDHKLPAWLLLGGVVVGYVLDLRLIRSMRDRDHLLTDPARSGRARSTRAAAFRLRRSRNGIYFARHRDRAIWPAPRARSTGAVLSSLGRLAGALGRTGGPRADLGWDIDPDDPGRARWYAPQGWTPYVATTSSVDLAPAPGRRDAVGITRADPPPGWAKLILLIASFVIAAIIVRLLTVPEEGPGGIQFAPDLRDPGPDPLVASLADAPNGPGPWTWGAGGGAGGGGPGPGPGDDLNGEPPPLPPDFFDDFGPPPDGPPEEPQEPDPEDECE